MTLQRAQTLALYSLVWAALGTVFSAEAFEWPLVLGIYMATIASLAIPHGLRERWAKSRLIGIALVLLLMSTTLEILSGSRDIVSGATLFLVFVLVSRLLTPRTPTDATTILTLSLVVVLAGSALNTSFAFAPFFLLVIVCSIWALTTTHLSRAAVDQPDEARGVRISRGYLLTTSLLALVIFAQTTVFFLIFPRMGLGYFKPKVRTSQSAVGFSDHVELGQAGTLENDNTVVLRIEFPDGSAGLDPDNGLYFRGATLTAFDGKAWQRPPLPQMGLRQRGDNRFPVRDETPRAAAAEHLHFRMYQEPGEAEFLFLPEDTVSIALLQDNPLMIGRPRIRFATDARGDLLVRRPVGMAVAVEGWLSRAVTVPLEAYAHPPGKAAPPMSDYLALPAVDVRVRTFASAWRGRAEAPADIVAAYTRFLSELTYSTVMVAPPEGKDPLAYFLGERREGHCEYFASAMAVMLRLSGVPARLVTGYRGATFNRYGDYWTVQENRAHTWVEYFDAEQGAWRRTDPTPPSRVRDSEALFERMAAFTDMLRYRWNRYVVEFDLDTQVAAVQSLRQFFDERQSRGPSFSFDRKLPNKRWLMAVGVLVVGGAALIWARRRGRAGVVNAERAASRKLRRLEALLARRGLGERPSSQPAATFLGEVAARSPEVEVELAQFREAYLRARFGATTPEDRAQAERGQADLARMSDVLRRLRRRPRAMTG